MTTNHVNYWKTVLATSVGATAVLAPGVAQAQQQVAQASGPVTSISQLSDVQPTDWAFQALQSLVERYGCIAGYPDRTYRGNRAMTRYEFAAGMNACLDRINELIAAGLADKVSREDLATLQRLQEEFAAELAALKGRVDVLEGDVADLQAQVFNPVTKLSVQAVAALTGSALTDDVEDQTTGQTLLESDAANMTFPYRVRMVFDASFVGNDRLRVRLQMRDAEPEFFSGDPGFWFGGGGGGDVVLDDLFYQFRPFTNTTVRIGVNSVSADALHDCCFLFESLALSDFGDNGPAFTTELVGDAAIAFNTELSEQFFITYGYSADSPTDPGASDGSESGATGFFGGDSSHGVELGFIPSDTLRLYFHFASTFTQDFDGFYFGSDTLYEGPDNLAIIESFGVSPFARVNAFSFGTQWEITPRAVFQGYVSFANYNYQLPDNVPVGTPDPGEEDALHWLAGFVFPDLFIEGAEGGVQFGQLPYSTDSDAIDAPFLVDVFYAIPINDFVRLVPSAYFISNPNGGDGAIAGQTDPTIGVGALQAQFTF